LHLFLGKSTKTATARVALFDSSMHQIVCRSRLHPRPHRGSLQRSPDLTAVYRGPTSKGRGGESSGGKEKRRRSEMRKRGEKERLEEGSGKEKRGKEGVCTLP